MHSPVLNSTTSSLYDSIKNVLSINNLQFGAESFLWPPLTLANTDTAIWSTAIRPCGDTRFQSGGAKLETVSPSDSMSCTGMLAATSATRRACATRCHRAFQIPLSMYSWATGTSACHKHTAAAFSSITGKVYTVHFYRFYYTWLISYTFFFLLYDILSYYFAVLKMSNLTLHGIFDMKQEVIILFVNQFHKKYLLSILIQLFNKI